MAFAGMRGTGDWGTDERPKNFREMILWANPNGSAPLTALLAKMKSEKVNDPEFAWWEETLTITRITTNLDMSASSTAAGTASGALALVPGDVLLIEKADQTTYDNEIVIVSSVASDTSFVVKRAQAGTSGAAAASGATMTRIGSVFEEGSTSPTVSNNNPTKKSNYCQIFKTAYELTNTAKETNARTGDALKNDKKRQMFKHSVNMELAFMFGKKQEQTGTGGKPMRFTGGLREFITTNKTVFSTTPTVDTFLNAVYPVFDYDTDAGGSTERIVLAGNGAINTLNQICKSAQTLWNQGTVKIYGMELAKYVLPQGTLAIKSHPLLNVHPRYKNSMFIVNPSAMRYRYLRDTKAMDNIQANDADELKGQWLTECGLEVNFETTMAYIGNFTNP